ncbi:MAG TPA: tyrosine--tRNA ligase [Candidatus Dormibacteraeota bacterium]|nr:tyrosine--tRNA ligase [Candidatus Dormibacteraeota bacterium]
MTSTKFPPVIEQLSYLKRGAAEVIRDEELKSKLENAERTGKPLRVYLGVDPTAPDIHLGHTVVLRKLKHFQDMGHTAIFLIGDFSAMIGDPTGQSETRPPLTREQVDANAKTYLDQVYKILDPKKTEVRYNSEWLGKMSSFDVVRLCGHYRLARMLEREDFRSRLEKNLPISVHELLYPLLTAYDAVALLSDVEIGATEQKFNLLVHRDIQREFGQPSEVALTMPILVGLDGERKMSKSLGNYVGITEAPSEMFGKLMSISDELMWSYYELLTDFPSPVIVRLKEEVRGGTLHPMDAKMQLAHAIIAGFHGEDAAKKASEEFQRVFRDRLAPEDVPEYRLRLLPNGNVILSKKRGDGESPVPAVWKLGTRPRWPKLLVELGIIDSTSEADRLVKQGGLEIDGLRLSDVKTEVDLSSAAQFVVKAGKKKFLKIIVE